MIIFLRFLTIISVGLTILSVSESIAQTNKIHQEAMLLQKVLSKNHYSPKNIDDVLSKEIFVNYLKSLDPQQLYFKAEDYHMFTSFELNLDDELLGKDWKFFSLVNKVYKDRLLEASKICESASAKPFDFTLKESLQIEEKVINYASDETALLKRWQNWLKYQTLWQLVNIYDAEGATIVSDKQLLEKEPEIRNKIAKLELRKINKIIEHPDGFENYLKSIYFNAITSCFDPHTNYFSKTELQNFKSQLATEGFSFGFDLDENEFGDVEIIRLVPGGPAWKSNELHKGDVLLKIKWINKQEYDLVGADLMEVENILSSSISDLLEITVRSTAGTIKTVKLKKEKISDADNIVKSFIIQGEKKVGYITLPAFYEDMDHINGLGCANDVAKEIVKLKKEKIDGLILDLRYNGGGSLLEGMNLTGIFIDEGPLLLIQNREGKANIMKDFNRGTIFDGPLLVMVNGQSASASEILASTLQDYNRAVIVGSPTYGKATGQVIFPLDPNQMDVNRNISPYGFVKVTGDKIYRITGKTAQLSGVQPDVYLPDVYEIFDYRELTYRNALSKDSINKKVVYSMLPLLPLSYLHENSQDRLLKHEGFIKINALQKGSNFKTTKKLKEIQLNISFFRELNKDNELWKSLLHYTENAEVHIIKVENPPFNQLLLNSDPYAKEVNEANLKNIQSDIYVEESYLILTDLINYNINK